jgi:hypothetical protein
MKDKIVIESIEEIDRSSWEKLKSALLEIQKELQDKNGIDYCRNCGMDYEQLIKDIEKIFL